MFYIKHGVVRLETSGCSRWDLIFYPFIIASSTGFSYQVTLISETGFHKTIFRLRNKTTCKTLIIRYFTEPLTRKTDPDHGHAHLVF